MSELNYSICSICLDELKNEICKNISITICNHVYHTSCLLKWKNINCPICRCSMYDENLLDLQSERRQRNMHEELTLDDFSIIEQIQETELTQGAQSSEVIDFNNTLMDEFYYEIKIVKKNMIKYLRKFLYILSQIVVVFMMAFGLNIITSLVLLLPCKGIIIVNKYLFQSDGH